jgi:lysophospholipase L1-like esterase
MEQALKSAAAHQMRIWDLHAESLRWDDRYLAEDGLHYNDAGHEMIAEHLLTMF